VPLTTLSEAGNAVLKRTFDPTQSFRTAGEFVVALRGSMGLSTTPPPPAPSTPAPQPAQQTVVPLRKPTKPAAVTLPPPIVSSARPLFQPAPMPVVPSPAAAQPAPKPQPAPAPKKGGGAALAIAGICGLALLGAGAYFLLPQFLGKHDIGGAGSPTPGPTPTIVKNTNTVDHTPTDATPQSGPTRQEQLQKAVKRASDTEQNGDIPATIATWNSVAREYPEAEIGRLRLEMFLDSIRNKKSNLGSDSSMLIGPLTESANLGVAGAMLLLADIERDTAPADAFRWYSQAAQKGLPDAFTQVGLMLANGKGTERDFAKAADNFQKAMERGDSSGAGFLGECYLYGKGVPKDEKHAIELLETGAKNGDHHAMTVLGDCYVRGQGVPRNSAEAFRLYSQAVKFGYGDAMGNLGVLYMKGDGVGQDPQRALELFRSGAKQGNATCMFCLAQSLDGTPGVTPNPVEAEGWYKKAAQLGHRKALEWCATHNVAVPQNY
jgi:TPR repeat protein